MVDTFHKAAADRHVRPERCRAEPAQLSLVQADLEILAVPERQVDALGKVGARQTVGKLGQIKGLAFKGGLLSRVFSLWSRRSRDLMARADIVEAISTLNAGLANGC